MQLTIDQKADVRNGKPVRVREDDLECVVLLADVFERFQGSLVSDGDLDVTAAYPLVNEVLADDDARDPLLDSYQKYRS